MNVPALAATAVLVAGVFTLVAARQFRALRFLAAVLLIAAALFSRFGFLASFEPPGWPGVRTIYAVGGVTSLFGAGWLTAKRLAPRHDR